MKFMAESRNSDNESEIISFAIIFVRFQKSDFFQEDLSEVDHFPEPRDFAFESGESTQNDIHIMLRSGSGHLQQHVGVDGLLQNLVCAVKRMKTSEVH